MKAAGIFLLFAVLASTNASPIFKLPHQRAIQEGAVDDLQPQPLWIIEAIAEGDLVKVAEIVDQHIIHLIETGKNVGGIYRVLARRLIDHIKSKLPTLHIGDNLKAKLVEILKRLQGHLAEIGGKQQEEDLVDEFSLIEDIKEVINQIKNQGGGIINTGKNIVDIIKDILG